MSDALIESLTAAVADRPDDVALRLHLAELLVRAGRPEEAVGHAARVLARDPENAPARRIMSSASGVDWEAFEREFRQDAVTLADVGGMEEVKQRLELAFLGPLRNPELRKLYGKSLRGGLLLYGPPGCGKTFLARAVAGEMGAAFLSLSITDVLTSWLGNSERKLHDLFGTARAQAPCVLFLDEIDALGHKRSRLSSSGLRNLVNQLLTELDGVDGGNEDVFVLAATNAPWDIDPALRRPGRLDRTVLVLPPDAAARTAILGYHLRERPVEGADLAALAAATEHFSGADLAHVCETAAEFALRDAISTGQARKISQADLTAAVREMRPSTDAWFATARNLAMFGNSGGEYDDLVAYLRKRKLL